MTFRRAAVPNQQAAAPAEAWAQSLLSAGAGHTFHVV